MFELSLFCIPELYTYCIPNSATPPFIPAMHWSVSVPLLCSSMLTFVTGALALQPRADKHYAIMDNDWYTAGFVPYLVALDGNVEILGLASGGYSHHCAWTKLSGKFFRHCQQLAAARCIARRGHPRSRQFELHSCLPGRHMAADQHPATLPGLGDDPWQVALGRRICTRKQNCGGCGQ